MLELKSISLERDDTNIIKDLSAVFYDGKVYAVLGNNGVGKSTLAYIIMGLESYRDYTGSVLWDGRVINGLSVPERARLGITLGWQEPCRFDGITVKEYLTLGEKKQFSIEKLVSTLDVVGLPRDYLSRTVDSSLSGGERKRIELASVILMEPRLVVLDEPDSGIDLMSTNMIQRVFNSLSGNGTTLIVITHREEIAEMTEEAYLMCGGNMLKNGDPQEIIAYYRTACDNCKHVNEPLKGVN